MSSGKRTRTLDDSTFATDPGGIELSHEKLRALRPDLYGVSGLWTAVRVFFKLDWPQRTYIEEQLQNGDSRAVVVSTAPLLIAAYTDELDCVAMLRFPEELVGQYRLTVGKKLLTVNTYSRGTEYQPDLILGPKLIRRWIGFHPLIADFLCASQDRVDARKKAIPAEEWQRAYKMGLEYLKLRPRVARDGRPVFASMPAIGR